MAFFSSPQRVSAVLVLTLAGAFGGAHIVAAQVSATPAAATAGNAKPPLAPLPTAPSLRLPEPTAAELQTLDAVLQRVGALRGSDVRLGLKEQIVVDSSLLAALRRRLDQEAEKADRGRMKRLLLDIRSEAREQLATNLRQSGLTATVETPDYLEMVLTHPQPESKEFASLVNVLAISRLCKTLESVEALRVLIRVYVRFDFLRIDTQLQLQQLGDAALPILIESTKHPAPNVARWASGQLDFLGKAIASEAVQVKEPQVLADVLRAYGRLRDPDAARLVVSFANSERAQVRDAARQSIGLFGEISNWALRDTYENMVGAKPPGDWSWDRTAKELFREFDLIRLAELYQFYDKGLKAHERGDLEEMRAAYEQVLTRDPSFQPNEQITKALLAYGKAKLEERNGIPVDALKQATAALQRVARASLSGSERAQAESLLLVAQVRFQVRNEAPEQLLLRRATQLDPNNTLAADLLKDISREPLAETGTFMRFLWPALLLVVSIACAGLVVLRRPKREEEAA